MSTPFGQEAGTPGKSASASVNMAQQPHFQAQLMVSGDVQAHGTGAAPLPATTAAKGMMNSVAFEQGPAIIRNKHVKTMTELLGSRGSKGNCMMAGKPDSSNGFVVNLSGAAVQVSGREKKNGAGSSMNYAEYKLAA